MNDLQEWTVMYFIAADANIAPSLISQLKAITDAGFQADTTVLVHFDPNANGLGGRLFDINRKRKKDSKRPWPTEIGDGRNFFVRSIRDACEELKPIKGDSASDTLAKFLEYARTEFRAKNYILFLIGHGVIVGSDSFLPDTDENSTSAISLQDLGDVLKKFRDDVTAEQNTFQLVGFHSCAMSSVEVAYQLKDRARYMIGTQGLTFPDSWPYRQILKMIFRSIEEQTRSQEGRKLLPDYDHCTRQILRYIQDLSFYNADDFCLAGYSADISMCSLDNDKIDPLTDAMKALSRSLQAALNDEAAKEIILLAHWKAQSYFQEKYTDLFDFCKCLADRCDPERTTQKALKQAATTVKDLLAEDPNNPFDRLILFSDFFGPEYQYSHGLSIYFPWAAPPSSVIRRYEGYAFEQALKSVQTNGDGAPSNDSWLSFLKAYFTLTQRSPAEREQEIEPSLNGGNGQSARVIRNATAKREAAVSNGNGKPASPLAIYGGKPTPSLAVSVGDEGKPTPSLAVSVGDEGKPTPSLAVSVGDEGKPTPSLAVSVGDEGKPTPSLAVSVGDEGKPTPSLAVSVGDEGKPTPSLAVSVGDEGKPTPSLAVSVGDEGKPTPSLAASVGDEGKPTPSLGVSGFGFTVTKNYPAPPPGEVFSSRRSRPRQDE